MLGTNTNAPTPSVCRVLGLLGEGTVVHKPTGQRPGEDQAPGQYEQSHQKFDPALHATSMR